MHQYGINVPPGIPAFSVKDVEEAAKKLADPETGEVGQEAASPQAIRDPCKQTHSI